MKERRVRMGSIANGKTVRTEFHTTMYNRVVLLEAGALLRQILIGKINIISMRFMRQSTTQQSKQNAVIYNLFQDRAGIHALREEVGEDCYSILVTCCIM